MLICSSVLNAFSISLAASASPPSIALTKVSSASIFQSLLSVLTTFIIKLNSKNYTAEINLSRGANCISLKNKEYNANILRKPDYSKEIDNPFLYGMPILFPVNRISNGEFEFEGRKYTFPINELTTNCHLHGFLHTAKFELVRKSESFVECRYMSDELYKFFPHKFSVEITYTLSENGLLQETCIYNLSDTNMPVFLGFHTTFNLPFVNGASAENIYVLAEVGNEIERNITNYLPTGKILTCDDISQKLNRGEFQPFGNKISKPYKAGNDGRIEILDKENRLRIVYENDKNFGWRLYYNGDADKFICLEPQTCMVNCQNSEFDRDFTGFTYIEPKSYKKYVSRIYIEEF